MNQLQVRETLPELSFNFEDLKAWAEGITENYKGLVVTEDMVPAIKSEMAGLNKMKRSLEDARKEAVRRVSAPIREFEAQVKEIVAVFDAARSGLDEQVKNYEEQAREQKRVKVLGIIEAVKLQHGVTIEIPVQDSWLNKTKTLKAVRGEVEGVISDHLEEMRKEEELKRAREERAFAIEQKVQARNEKDVLTVPVATFNRAANSDMSLIEVFAIIDNHFDRLASERSAEQPKAEKPALRKKAAAREPEKTVEQGANREPVYNSVSIAIRYDMAREGEVTALLKQLKSVCVGFVIHHS